MTTAAAMHEAKILTKGAFFRLARPLAWSVCIAWSGCISRWSWAVALCNPLSLLSLWRFCHCLSLASLSLLLLCNGGGGGLGEIKL